LGKRPVVYGRRFEEMGIEKAKKAYPIRKLTKADGVARAVLFLASERCAGDVTGQSLSVDGGYAMV